MNWSYPALYTPALLPFICTACATLLAFRHSFPAGTTWRDPFAASATKCKSVCGGVACLRALAAGQRARPHPTQPAVLPCPPPERAGVAPAIVGAFILVVLMVQGGRQVRQPAAARLRRPPAAAAAPMPLQPETCLPPSLPGA